MDDDKQSGGEERQAVADAENGRSSAGPRGRMAERPSEIPRAGWLDAAKRTYRRIGEDKLTLVAAGVAFYLFLAIFPALAALFTIFGLVADPGEIQQQVERLGALPEEVRNVVGQQLERQAERPASTLGWTLALSVLLALWSTSKGMASLILAMNIAYDQDEQRPFWKRTLLALAFSLGAIVLAIVAVTAIAAVPTVMALVEGGTIELGVVGRWLTAIASWVLLLGAFLFALALLFRFAPKRRAPRWRWITPGAGFAIVAWTLASAAFSLYVANFGSYDRTYGSFAGVIVMLLWLWLSALVVLVGAELNAELEHQTRRDTTRDGDQPRGERGAFVADHVGREPS